MHFNQDYEHPYTNRKLFYTIKGSMQTWQSLSLCNISKRKEPPSKSLSINRHIKENQSIHFRIYNNICNA